MYYYYFSKLFLTFLFILFSQDSNASLVNLEQDSDSESSGSESSEYDRHNFLYENIDRVKELCLTLDINYSYEDTTTLNIIQLYNLKINNATTSQERNILSINFLELSNFFENNMFFKS
jgi:hypothetical protein